MVKSVYEEIKNQNGQSFARYIRTHGDGIFEIKNIKEILKFAGTGEKHAKALFCYLSLMKGLRTSKEQKPEDPFELLKRAGYDAYYADTLEKQNAISKYFTPKEALCTFDDPTCFQRYYIINAVKEDADEINRETFRGKEKREDRYGTSVISILVAKVGYEIRITNRYNHTVDNPDNTFGANPDNIIVGLGAAIKHYFNTNYAPSEAQLTSHFTCVGDKIIHYNYEENDIYYGSNFYATDRTIYPLKRHEIMMDNYILNLRDHTLSSVNLFHRDERIDLTPGKSSKKQDSFISVINQELKGKKLQIRKNKETKYHEIWADGTCIIKINQGRIVELYLPTTKTIGDDFLLHNTALKKFTAPNLTSVGKNFLCTNSSLKEISVFKLDPETKMSLKQNNPGIQIKEIQIGEYHPSPIPFSSHLKHPALTLIQYEAKQNYK